MVTWATCTRVGYVRIVTKILTMSVIMQFTPKLLPDLIEAIAETIEQNSAEIIALDQAIGDGDHLFNLQRGIQALKQQNFVLAQLGWEQALQKIGMILLTTMGGASGSLFGTFFIAMGKAIDNEKTLNQKKIYLAFAQAVDAVKNRGKAVAGEKTMLDVLIPVTESMGKWAMSTATLVEFFDNLNMDAIKGAESTRNMLATKGRASFLQAKSIGHIDAGARTSQLIICAIVRLLKKHSLPSG